MSGLSATQDANAAAGQSRNELSQAAALEAKLKQGFWRAHALAYLRTPSFIQVDSPGLPPYTAFERDAELRSEVSGTLGVDYFFQDWGVTPGVLARVALPAAFQGRTGLPPTGADRRNVVLRAPNQLSFLPDSPFRRTTPGRHAIQRTSDRHRRRWAGFGSLEVGLT